MKHFKLLILFIAFTKIAGSQVVFNRIVEDTINQITTSVVATDTGYVFVAGTGNEYGVRSFAFTSVDLFGNKNWKKIYGDTQYEFWEGWDGNLQNNLTDNSLCGPYKGLTDGKKGIHISSFDNEFNVNFQQIVFYDSVWKGAFYHIKSSTKDFYVTGQIVIADDIDRLLLLKADSLGNYLWHKTLGNYVYEYGSYLLETSTGTILSGGETWLTDISRAKWYLVNTDTAGNIIWEKYYGRNNYNNGYLSCILEANDTNIFLSGSYPVARFGGGTGEYLWDACLRKIDTNGNLLWERLFRNYSCHPTGTNINLSGSIKTVLELDNGDLILCGSSQWYYTILRGYLIKTDSEGNIKWKRYYYADDYTSTWQYFSSIKATSDEGFIIAGYGDDYSSQGYDPPQQAWLVKTDSLGMDGLCNIEPDELNLDFDVQEVPEGICMNDTIEVYVHIAGKSAPYTIEFSTGQVIDSIYYPPTFVPVEIGLTDINLTWGGETYFEESITEATLSNHEWGQCIVKPIEFYTPSTWGPQQLQITVTDAYGESMTITKEIFAVQCTSENVSANTIGFKIYPNPATDVLNIEVPENFNGNEIYIFNSLGQIVKSLQISNDLTVISIKDFASGVYQIKITDGDGNVLVRSFEKQ